MRESERDRLLIQLADRFKYHAHMAIIYGCVVSFAVGLIIGILFL